MGINYLSHLSFQLESLSLGNCNRISYRIFIKFLKNCTELQRLNLENTGNSQFSEYSKNVGINDNVVYHLTMSCTKLRSLNISRNKQVTKNSIRAISKSCVLMRKLNMADCPLLTDDTLKIIGNVTYI
jgi:hypothetical protein